MLTFEEVSHFY